MKAVDGFSDVFFRKRGKKIRVATSWEVADWRYLESSKFKHKQETDFASFMWKVLQYHFHTKWVSAEDLLRKFNGISEIYSVYFALFVMRKGGCFSVKVKYLCLVRNDQSFPSKYKHARIEESSESFSNSF
jgi:hypothetical protein